MKPFRKHVSIAVDGGGIRGVIVTRALMMLEDALGKSCHEIFRLAAGTSTGSIVSAAIGAGLTAEKITQLYVDLGKTIFQPSWRTFFWPLTKYRYPQEPFKKALLDNLGDIKMGDFWEATPPTDVVIIAFDLLASKACFIKPWKPEYKDFSVATAVLASSCVPSYFPVVEGRFVDGGVGSYANPCYIAAYEAVLCLGWEPEETTLISLGTGRSPSLTPGEPEKFRAWQWLEPIEDAIFASTSDQQIHLVETFFSKLDFRRFQVNLREYIPMDDTSMMDNLLAYGEQLGEMVLNDKMDSALGVKASLPPRNSG
jgi:hypothetical protein